MLDPSVLSLRCTNRENTFPLTGEDRYGVNFFRVSEPGPEITSMSEETKVTIACLPLLRPATTVVWPPFCLVLLVLY